MIITLHYPDALWKWNEIHFNAGHREPFPSPSHVLNQHYPVSIQFQYTYTFFFIKRVYTNILCITKLVQLSNCK